MMSAEQFSWLCFDQLYNCLLLNRIKGSSSRQKTKLKSDKSQSVWNRVQVVSHLDFTSYIHLLEANCESWSEHNRKLKCLCWKNFNTVDLNSKCLHSAIFTADILSEQTKDAESNSLVREMSKFSSGSFVEIWGTIYPTDAP